MNILLNIAECFPARNRKHLYLRMSQLQCDKDIVPLKVSPVLVGTGVTGLKHQITQTCDLMTEERSYFKYVLIWQLFFSKVPTKIRSSGLVRLF